MIKPKKLLHYLPVFLHVFNVNNSENSSFNNDFSFSSVQYTDDSMIDKTYNSIFCAKKFNNK